MNDLSSITGAHSEKTRVVEIVGPAGAGKTTVYQKLKRYTKSVRLENFPNVRKITDAPFFISNGIQLIPNLLHLYRSGSRQLTRREFAWLTILSGWSALLTKETNNEGKAYVLDQGPIYLLAEMWLFGPEYLRQKAAQGFWEDLYNRWTATLYMVIWLDASDDVLFTRIRNRRQDHMMKTQPASVVYEFLNCYRNEYEFILSTLTKKKVALKVLKFDTGWEQPQEIVNRFLSELSY